MNIPIRSRKAPELRAARIGVVFLSGAVLLVAVINGSMVVSIGTGFGCHRSAVLLSAGPRSGISTEGSSLCQILLTGRGHCRNFGSLALRGKRSELSVKGMSSIRLVPPCLDYQQLGVRLSRHRWGFSYWDANNSGPVRTTEYDLFVDRVGGSLGWGERLAGNERICESVTASGLSRRQCRIILCGNQPDLSDDDQCLGRPVTRGPCGRRNRCSSMAACGALKLPPQCLDLRSRDCFRTVETRLLRMPLKGGRVSNSKILKNS